MISINDLTFLIGARALYDEANWHIKPGDRAGLIGANGTGKSTLLKIIVGEYAPTSGTVSMSKDLKIGYLNQDLLSYDSHHSILHVAMEAFERQNQLHDEIEVLLKKIETDYSEEVLNKLSDKQQEFEALDGYNIEYRAHEILAGLGFSTEDQQRPLNTFSGGWRMRVMLAKILLQTPDILLLDEPTNHMDLPSIKWLETYLSGFEGAIVIVSHDRYFLDKIVNKTVESRKGKLTVYAGNYSFYLEEKALREEIQRGEFKNQQAKIKQEERLIERFKAKASKAKMAQSRMKALDRMERVDDVDDDNPTVNFQFKFTKPSGRHVIRIESASKSYPNVDILKDAEGVIEKGDKIALIGANGKGKSTLLRIIAGTEDFSGTCVTGHNVTQTFFAQHQLESLHLDNSILEELQAFAPKHTDTELRGILGCFLFTGDDVFKKIRVLSGGEKSRVALAKSLTTDSNFLILDEPTNHLDIQSVNILIQALQQYEGTFITVSHDRYFLDNVANKIWFIEDQKIKEYPGTYAEYEEWAAKRPPARSSSIPVRPDKQVKKEEKPAPVSAASGQNPQQQLKKLNEQLKKIETDIAGFEANLKEMEMLLADENIYADAQKLAEANKKYNTAKTQLDAAQKDWEGLAGEIMELEAQ
ncbi:ABC-F family ATP-binding cassette domain-containing protein [Pedobacter sp. JY14-1]|uniref:ABC-F family ATP-binding cassette domain-containing protein n=1 Tax=Pedobacter sp. JY14-1 TaxID=3034151 RepID=UPI0023E0FEBE|nr:ABC-F family ATP-binding cassette domain-containing protein [Pedobacter sp. JY14-1]